MTIMKTKSVELNKDYWDAFYKANHKHVPSQFAVCVLTEIKANTAVVELGSGNGRDSHYFASQGHITFGIDLSHQALKSCEDEAKLRNIEHSSFYQSDLTNFDGVQNVIARARVKTQGAEIIFYSRFVMHSLDNEQEQKFLTILSECMQPGEIVYFEFRSKEDAVLKKHYGGHFRRFVDTENFIDALVKKHSYGIEYSITGKGMAKYLEEDPSVSRVFARKK